MPTPSRLVIAPRCGRSSVLAFACARGRYYPIVAIGPPLGQGLLPFPRIATTPLPHLLP